MEHVAGTFLYKNLQRRQIVLIASRNQRVGNVQLIIVMGRVHHCGHAPLGQRTVGQGQFPFAHHKHPQGTRQVERRVKPCHAAPAMITSYCFFTFVATLFGFFFKGSHAAFDADFDRIIITQSPFDSKKSAGSLRLLSKFN